jgi:hypothetical protein
VVTGSLPSTPPPPIAEVVKEQPKTVEIESGVVAPVSEQPNIGQPVVATVSDEKAEPTTQVLEPGMVVPTDNAEKVEANWKDNLTFEQQKNKIITSEDKTFLEMVKTAKGDGKQFKNLAKARLAELK